MTRLVGGILLKQNEEWAGQRARYMTLETMAPLSDDPIVSCQLWPADLPGPRRRAAKTYTTPRDTIL